MKLKLLPAPNGMPKAMGAAQWIDAGRHVQEKPSWPVAVSTAPMTMMVPEASGRMAPVSGSRGCAWMMRRSSGSQMMAVRVPIPMPVKARPVVPGSQPRCCEKTMG